MAVKRGSSQRSRRLDRAAVLEQLQTGSVVTLEGLLDSLGLGRKKEKAHARRQLRQLLQALVREGAVERVGGDRYRMRRSMAPSARQPLRPTAGLFVGRVVVHRDGYGFVVPRDPIGIEGDLFVPPGQLGDAMHGDEVLARLERRRPDGRGEGRIVRVLRRAHPAVVGVFHYTPRGGGGFVVPFEPRLQEIVIPPGQELPENWKERPVRGRVPELEGAAVNVELTRFPRAGLAPVGRVVEVLGRPGDAGVDVEIIVRKHQLPHVFPPEVREQARTIAPVVPTEALEGRRDFRSLPIVTIDGETARDFDDAVYVRRLADGYELQVHIADVAHYVPRGSPLDQEARLRGTSVYFPDRAIPMLPEELSNGICSLRPGEDRLVMSVLMHLDSRGQVRHVEFTPGVIRSAARMTYTAVDRILEGDPEALAQYRDLVDGFRLMKELALILYERRRQRGAIDFDLPEPVIEFDELGRILTIGRSQRTMANRIIEEFMLAANERVAAYLTRRGVPMLHRVHEPPDPARVLEFEELAQAFGYSLGVPGAVERVLSVRHGRTEAARGSRQRGRRPRALQVGLPASFEVRPQHYQRLVEKIAGRPEERILSYLMLRSLKQARYAAEPLGHFALATQTYTHFTSPIRRYPDLVVHRILKWALAHPDQPPEAAPYHLPELQEIASESSEAERRADEAERELTDWKTAQFMEQHLGEEYEALIVSVQKFGFFVELFEVFVEGLVPVTRLEALYGERFVWREADHALVSRSHRFRLGQRLRVRAERIDPFVRRVEFAPVADPGSATGAGRRR